MKKQMKKLLFLVMPIYLIGNAQNKGIQFEQGLNWQQIKEKAKTENKCIFVDCYATWCGPCKYMDKYVYEDESVGSFINRRFISVKLQTDTSRQDNEEVKKWYSDAHTFQKEYVITAIPAYLFFSADGNIIHRDIGVKEVSDFLITINHALNPEKQYYTQLKAYKLGKKDYLLMPYLALMAKSFNDNELANTIARDYFTNYLFTLKESELCSKKNIEFIYSFNQILTSEDKGFDIFFRYGSQIDDTMNFKGLSQMITDYIITKEEIDPVMENINKSKTYPSWSRVTKRIKRKYGVIYAERNVLNAKVSFYEKIKSWKEYLKYAIKKQEKSGIDTANVSNVINTNYTAWMIFLHSSHKKQINIAIKWMESLNMSTTNQAGWLDTYANLLYKAGRVEEALKWEEKALRMAPTDKDIEEAFAKMKKGKKTW
ncbi:DUF255 domain-containing protein [Niastella caeni]|uniref:DUF255 domain-containing protein n=1 Tax=Niastella caeni TaxID=2569763 RepID=A0A4S8HHP6_9BACT|nr:thioredoxin family protein [Niastella caeni]THU34738.1 DUF255 domain-containing protein [Niastella caeni]